MDFKNDCFTFVVFTTRYRSSRVGTKVPFTLRDLLGWISFINRTHSYLGLECSLVHGICLVIFDGLGSFLTGEPLYDMKKSGRKFFKNKFSNHACDCFDWITSTGNCSVTNSERHFKIGPFSLEKRVVDNRPTLFHFGAPTVSKNTLKILRALQIDNKAVLLEGLPGVGKSSLVEALAKMTGNSLVRINLSDQTEISDLFGADLPTETGSSIASFSWHDGPFLSALRSGQWILLDELNLATQSVLEGLNACLDHRGKIYIPELNRSFEISQTRTRIFGCQNPPREGGDRKNLPKSFLNRFVKVYLSEFDPTDLALICSHQFPSLSQETISKLVRFAVELHKQACVEKTWGYSGSPWQFNLRDLLRWCQAVSEESHLSFRFAELIFIERFRMECDREAAHRCLSNIVENDPTITASADSFFINKNILQIGSAVLHRSNKSLPSLQRYRLLHCQYEILESLMFCVKNNWLAILVGQSDTGKSSLVNILSDLVGHPLHSITLTTASDTSELLGGFEQTGPFEKLAALAHQLVDQVLNDLEEYRENHQVITRLVHIQMRLRRIRDDNLNLAELETIVDEYHSVVKTSSDNWKARLSSLKEKGKIGFEWMDSVLIRAVKNGDWLLLDDANLCNSAVLDRLNSLLEPNGVLVVGERGCSDEDGKIPTVVPHPNFRLFLTMNPHHGELSPAIRNRGVEIFIDKNDDSKNVEDECLIRDLSTYSSATLLLRQNKLLEDLSHTKGMHLSVAAKALLSFATVEDLEIREAVFSRQFKLQRPALFDSLRILLTKLEAENGFNARSSNEVVAFAEAVFAVEMLQQKPATNFSNLSLSVKQLWASLVAFASQLFNQVQNKILNFQEPKTDDVLSIIILSNLFQTMRSRLDSASSDSSIMKQWSLSWLRLQNFLSENTSSQFVSSEIIENETEISSTVKPYFSAFNLSVRDFWSSIGLPLLNTISLQILDERKQFYNLSLKLALTTKTDLPSICDHIGKISKSISNNVESLAQIFEKLPLQDNNNFSEDLAKNVSKNDILKLQFALLAGWNAYLKNISVAIKIGDGNQLGSSILFSLESINWLRTANKSDLTKEQAFEFQALSVQQQIVIQHIFKHILAAKDQEEQITTDDSEDETKKDEVDAELRSLTQLMLQVAMGKRDFSDVEISIIDERRQQLLALQTQLVADCRDVVKYETSAEKANMDFCLENFATILQGIDSLELPIIQADSPQNSNTLISYSKLLKKKVGSSKFFPKHLQVIITDVLTLFEEEFESIPNNFTLMRLCSGLLLLHVSSELGFVDISEHLTSTAEAIESEITLMTWVMIAEDTCNSLVKVDEPLPVRPSQSERRQLLGNYVKKQVIYMK